MVDINEIRKRAQQASERASEAMKKTFEKSEELVRNLEISSSEKEAPASAAEAEEQIHANAERQVEILGQILGADGLAQMAASEELLQKMVNEKVAETAASTTENLMGQLFGEDMGILAAALETLEMEDAGEEEEPAFNLELEQTLYTALEEAMARLEAIPEPEPIPYQKNDARWERFGILLSGILSTLNNHNLYSMDVEEHIPVMEQKIVSLVRRSWGINGRSDLLDMIRYLAQEGYILRYQLYSEASSPEELMDETMDEDDCESARRAWRFAQRYKSQYAPGFMAGWDIGRAAMLTRWGCYLGWLTESEAVGILWELSQKAAEELHSWREFAQSYLFGGLMWKLLCGDSSAGSYLGYLADAATDLLTGKAEQDGGQWREYPWPAQRKIGFTFS
ncbi:MAG TPA: DUF1266 domain-containing protein [Candidatus Merdivicinus excrementipullorum]|uniref:DUF1266 domain-containing protein n=1 Tax=Candidatus Merdivicinus excrementipullorum TaxID=2840867 RepID=A0A9D1FLE2_9FIRM|nr:DUF1266 domain-containing protein [Candidatus Merdivicinus excrementipullorum]